MIPFVDADLLFHYPRFCHQLAEDFAFFLRMCGQLGREAHHQIKSEIVKALLRFGYVECCGDVAVELLDQRLRGGGLTVNSVAHSAVMAAAGICFFIFRSLLFFELVIFAWKRAGERWRACP